jgi:hypothetical protein
MIPFHDLRTRFLADTALGADGATPSIARALERIGWRAVREPTPQELADELVVLFDDCVRAHRDVPRLAASIAMVLRDAGPLLDGGLPPVDAYGPAAEELLQQYLRADHPSTFDPFV